MQPGGSQRALRSGSEVGYLGVVCGLTMDDGRRACFYLSMSVSRCSSRVAASWADGDGSEDSKGRRQQQQERQRRQRQSQQQQKTSRSTDRRGEVKQAGGPAGRRTVEVALLLLLGS